MQHHQVQLVAVTATAVVARVRESRDTDPLEHRITPRRATVASLSEDGLVLALNLRASAVVRLAESEVWDARVDLVGRFTSAKALTDDEAAFFARTSGLYVLWPFARSAIDGLARLAGVSAPILPLLVRPSTQPRR